MVSDSKTILAASISLILAVSAFYVVSSNAPHLTAKVTEQGAIDIIRNSDKVYRTIVYADSPKSADLRYLSLDWANILSGRGEHTRIYVSTTPVGEARPYWFIDYSNTWNGGWNSGEGSYIVDAQTGELMLSVEKLDGGISITGFDYLLSTSPKADDPNSPLALNPDVQSKIVIKLIAPGDSYDASLPVSIRLTRVPAGVNASLNSTSGILKTGGFVSFELNVNPSSNAPSRFSVNYEIILLYRTDTGSLYFSMNP